MTTTQAAEHFGVSAKTIRRWIHSGKLEAVRRDGRWVIHNNALSGSHLAHEGDHSAHLHSQLARADSEIAYLRDQLDRRDEQVDHLTQLLAIAQKNVAVRTSQLSASKEMIEVKLSRSWWKRILSRS
jgi:excisionase family DNA binding protein